MKRILIVLMMFISVLTMVAQQELKRWDDGELSWSDFKGEAGTGAEPSLLMLSLDVIPQEVASGKDVSYKVDAVAVMDCNASYANASAKTDDRLKYHQVQFDLLELYRRRLQWDLLSGGKASVAEKLERYRAQFKEQIAQLNKQTSNGKDNEKVQEFIYDTRMRINDVGNPQSLELVPADWKYGFYVGVGGNFPTAEVKDYFGGCAMFTAGITAAYKRLNVKADISYGQAGFNKPNVFGTIDSKGRPLQGPMSDYANYLGAGFMLGFNVVDTRSFGVSPYVGVNYGGYSWNMANIEYKLNEETGKDVQKVKNTETARLGDWSWRAGIDLDFKIHRSKFNLSGKRTQYTSMVRVTPYVSYINLEPVNARGCQFGFTVAYVGLSRSLKVK